MTTRRREEPGDPTGQPAAHGAARDRGCCTEPADDDPPRARAVLGCGHPRRRRRRLTRHRTAARTPPGPAGPRERGSEIHGAGYAVLVQAGVVGVTTARAGGRSSRAPLACLGHYHQPRSRSAAGAHGKNPSDILLRVTAATESWLRIAHRAACSELLRTCTTARLLNSGLAARPQGNPRGPLASVITSDLRHDDQTVVSPENLPGPAQ